MKWKMCFLFHIQKIMCFFFSPAPPSPAATGMVEVDYPPPSPRPPSPPLPPPPPHATEGELPPPAVPPHFMEKGEYCIW